MDQDRFPIALVAGVGIVLLAALTFIGVSVARNAAAPPPTATPVPSTATQSPVAPPTRVPSPTPAPTAVPNLPTVAPDFTLRGARGITLTLSAQLTKGPVVLVFFTSGGG